MNSDMGLITLTDGTSEQVGLEAFANSKCFFKRQDIKTVVLPEGIKTIRKESFSGCTSLEEVKIPYGVTSIEPEAFSGCTKLRQIEFPASLKTLGRHAFACSGLQSVDLPQRLKTVDKEVFINCPDIVTFTVPEGYKADSFGVYADKVENIVCPQELSHLLKYAPRSSWYYSLKIKSLPLLHEMLEAGQAFETPVLICLYSEKLLGPFFSPKHVFEELNPMLKESISSIEESDIELLAANIAIELLDNPELTEYRITGDEDQNPEVCFFKLDGYNPERPIYIVECEMWHESSFHPWEEVYGAFCSLEAAENMADTLEPYYSYPISRSAPTIRIWPYDNILGYDYVPGYGSRYNNDNEYEYEYDHEYDHEIRPKTSDRTLYIPLILKTDPNDRNPIQVKARKAYVNEDVARSLMRERFEDAVNVIGADLQTAELDGDLIIRLQDGSLIQHTMLTCRIDKDIQEDIRGSISMLIECEYKKDSEAIVLANRQVCAIAKEIYADDLMLKLYRKKARKIKASPETYGSIASKCNGFYDCTIYLKDSTIIQFSRFNVKDMY